MEETLRVVLVDERATVPTRGSEGAAGYDISAISSGEVKPGKSTLVETGLKIGIPKGHYARLADRSGLAYRNGLHVLAGVIDLDYRGPVKIILLNTSDKTFTYKQGDRIAQLILEKISTPPVTVVQSLDETERAENGFGSTGINNKKTLVEPSVQSSDYGYFIKV